ncbi:hypothetical protein M5585_04695 [Serratia ureilytica]
MKGRAGLGVALWCLALGAAQAQDKQQVSRFQDAPVTVILQALADYRQMNLIAAPGVSGNLTLRLENVPWPQALALTLRMGKLTMTREGRDADRPGAGRAGKNSSEKRWRSGNRCTA